MNEVAGVILGLERAEVFGKRFEDLDTRHPHYVRIREAARDFLSRHELRAPLTSLGMALDLPARDHVTAAGPARELLQAAEEDLRRLEDTAQRLLNVSRARATGIAPDGSRCTLERPRS